MPHFHLSIYPSTLRYWKLLPLHSLVRHLYLLVFCGLDDVWTWFSLNLSCFAFTKLLEICKSVSFTKFGNSSAFMFSNIFSPPITFSFPSATPIPWVLHLPYCPSGPWSSCFVLFSLPNGSFLLICLQAYWFLALPSVFCYRTYPVSFFFLISDIIFFSSKIPTWKFCVSAKNFFLFILRAYNIIIIIAAFKFLSEDQKSVSFLAWHVLSFPLWINDISLVPCVSRNFVLYPGHFEYYVVRHCNLL